MKKNVLAAAFQSSLPLMIGYIPVGITYGLICKNTGLGLWECVSASLFIYAGASQFMLLELLQSGVGAFSIALAVILLNARFFILSTSIGIYLKKMRPSMVPIFAVLLTDESFSYFSFQKDRLTTKFAIPFEIFAYLSWFVGSAVGYLVGEVLPDILQQAMSGALLILFITLLVPSIRSDKRKMKVSFLSMAVFIVFSQIKILPTGWDIVFSILVSSAIGVKIIGD